MASVYKPTGRNIYRIEFKDQHGKTRTISSGTADKRLAESLGMKIEEDGDRIRVGIGPLHPDLTGPYLGLAQIVRCAARSWPEATEEYLADLVRRGSPKAGSHYRDVQMQLDKVAHDCHWRSLADVAAKAFAAFLDGLREAGRAPRTLNKYHQCVNAFIEWCRSPPRSWIAANPLDGMARAKGGRQARRRLRQAYTPAELARLLAAAPDRRRIVYEIAAYSGLRREELRRLQKCDCDPTGPRPRWHMRPKSARTACPGACPCFPSALRSCVRSGKRFPPLAVFSSVPAVARRRAVAAARAITPAPASRRSPAFTRTCSGPPSTAQTSAAGTPIFTPFAIPFARRSEPPSRSRR